MLFTSGEAVKELPLIDDKNLFQAVSLALWLYLDKHWGLKTAVNKAAEKYSIKPKVAIERLMRQVIPEEVIWGRANGTKRTNGKGRDSGAGNGRIILMEKSSRKHINDIAKR